MTAMYVLLRPFGRPYGACWVCELYSVALTTLRLTVRLSGKTIPLSRSPEYLHTKGRIGYKLSCWWSLLWTALCRTWLCCHWRMLRLVRRSACLWTTWTVCTLYRLRKIKYKVGRNFVSWCSIVCCKRKCIRRSTLMQTVGMLNMQLATRFYCQQRTCDCMGPGNS